METVTDTIFRIIYPIFHKIPTGVPISGLTQKSQETIGHCMLAAVSSHDLRTQGQKYDRTRFLALGYEEPRVCLLGGSLPQELRNREVRKLILLFAAKKELCRLHHSQSCCLDWATEGGFPSQ